jgi:hypothetical protein
LESAAGGVSRATLDKLISTLGKRIFIMHNIHEPNPVVFQTRWTMNFLAGPLTRTQIPDLNELVHAMPTPAPINAKDTQSVAATLVHPALDEVQTFAVNREETQEPPAPTGRTARSKPVVPAPGDQQASETKPSLPAGIREYFLPQNYSLPEAFDAAKRGMAGDATIQGVVYRPSLLASAQVRILDRKYGVDTDVTRTALVASPDKRGMIRWDEFAYNGPSLDNIDTMPVASARFGLVDTPLSDTKQMTALQKDFIDWVFRNSSVTARANTALKVYAGPDVSPAEFMKACADTAREARDAEIAKKTATIDRQIKTLEDKLTREERELQQDEQDLQSRKLESGANLLELGAGLMGIGRKKSVTSQFTKHRLTENAKAEVEESIDAIAQFKKQLVELQRQREETVQEINDRWGSLVNETTEVTVNPKKTDVFVKLFGVAWMPYYIVESGTETFELPAFGAQ